MKKTIQTTAVSAASAALLALAAFAPGQAGAAATVTDKWVTIVLPAEPNDIEPCHSSRAFEGRVVKYNINETLIQKNAEDGKLMPRLATSWEQVDPSTWRFKLREGVKFHNGKDFNAETAKISIDRNWNKNLACGDRSKFFGDVNIEVKPVGSHEIEIKTSRPEPILPMRLTGLVIAGPDEPTDKVVAAGQGPVGTGPFVFDSWRTGTEILLARNENYWGKKPTIEGMRYIWRDESSVRASMVEIGEADIALTIAPQDANNPNLDHSYLNSETSFMRLDTEMPPMNDVRVRKAMNYALDLASMPGTILPKSAIRATQMVMPSIPGHNHELDKRPYPYDPEKAKALIAEAKKDGVPVGNEMMLVSYPAHYPNAGELMEAFASMWRSVGLNIKLQTVEPGQYQEFNNRPFAADRLPRIQQSSHDNNFGDPVFSVFFKYGCKGSTSAYCDPKFDEEVLRVSGLSGEERVKGWQELFRYLYEDTVPSVMMFHQVAFTRVSPRVDFVPDVTSNAEIRGEEINFTGK